MSAALWFQSPLVVMLRDVMRHSGYTIAAVGALAMVAGCATIAGLGDFDDEPPGGSSTTTTSGGSTSTGGQGGVAAGGATGGGGTAGGGGGQMSLVDDGLVVRYFLDEAASGQGPTQALDAAMDPVDLTIAYGGDDAFNFTEIAGNRGVQWNEVNHVGKVYASPSIDGTKLIAELNGSQTATIEVVAKVEDVPVGNDGFFWNVRSATAPHMAFGMSDITTLFFNWNGSFAHVGSWSFNLNTGDRVILHLVLDTTLGPNQRVVLHAKDGSPTSLGGATPPGSSEGIDLSGTDYYLALGNSQVGTNSFQGVLHYAAVYNRALSSHEIARNRDVLSASDDEP